MASWDNDDSGPFSGTAPWDLSDDDFGIPETVPSESVDDAAAGNGAAAAAAVADSSDVKKKTSRFKRNSKKSVVNASETVRIDRKKSNVIFRNIILVVSALLMAFGAYRIIVPEKQLTADEITAAAASGMGVTSFPAASATTFVTNFSSVFFTYSDDRQTSLARYGLQSTSFNPPEATTIQSGPFIGDIDYQSQTTAALTVSAKTSTLGWVYFSVPIYYDSESNSFLVLGDPTAVPAPTTAQGSPELDKDALGSDLGSDMATSVTPTVETFFKAFGESDKNALQAVTISGTSEARVFDGFAGQYEFVSADDIRVRQKPTMPSTNFWVTVNVTWRIATASGSDISGNTIVSAYQLRMSQDAAGKFYVVDIQPATYTVKSFESSSSTSTVDTGTQSGM